MQGQGRAERGWHTFPNEDLVAQLDGRRFDLRRGCGVEKHHGKRRPSHLRQSSTHAHSMQQHASRCNRARAQTVPKTPRQPWISEKNSSSSCDSRYQPAPSSTYSASGTPRTTCSMRACAHNLGRYAGMGHDLCRFESTGGPSIFGRNCGVW